jgi:hypothetical protein
LAGDALAPRTKLTATARVIPARSARLPVVKRREVDVECRPATRIEISASDEVSARCTGRAGRAGSRRSARPGNLLVQILEGVPAGSASPNRVIE